MGREESTREELDAGGLTREETTLIFELHNAAARVDFVKLNKQAEQREFESATLMDLPPALRGRVEKASDIPEMLFAMQAERLEYSNVQRSWRVIKELHPTARNSAASRRLQGLAEGNFTNYMTSQVDGQKGHFDRLRRIYRTLCPIQEASAS